MQKKNPTSIFKSSFEESKTRPPELIANFIWKLLTIINIKKLVKSVNCIQINYSCWMQFNVIYMYSIIIFYFCTFYIPNIIPKSSSCSYISVIFLWTKSSLHYVHIWCKSSDQNLKFIYITLHNILYCNLTFKSLHDSWHTNFYLAFQKSVSLSSKLFHLKVSLA